MSRKKSNDRSFYCSCYYDLTFMKFCKKRKKRIGKNCQIRYWRPFVTSAPLSLMPVHAEPLRMRTNVVYFRVMQRLYRCEWNWLWVNYIHVPAHGCFESPYISDGYPWPFRPKTRVHAILTIACFPPCKCMNSGECIESLVPSSNLVCTYRHRFHEVRALRALMHAARALRENGDDMLAIQYMHWSLTSVCVCVADNLSPLNQGGGLPCWTLHSSVSG